MKFDLVVRGGTIVRHNGRIRADIGVIGEQIADIGNLTDAPTKEVVDASDCMVLPGVIDPHVHMTILAKAGQDEKQLDVIERDFESESIAAAFGGVTTYLPMINLNEGTYSARLDRLISAIQERSYIDAGMTVIVMLPEHVQEIPQLVERGISGFKHFFNAYRKDEVFGSLLPVDERLFIASLEAIRNAGPPAVAMAHAEDADLIYHFETLYQQNFKKADLESLSAARPGYCEVVRMRYAAECAKSIGARLYFMHCTSFEGLNACSQFIDEGTDLSVEAVTHCLTTTYDVWDRVGVWAKFSPPIRGEKDRKALWGGIRTGYIRHVASDHCVWSRAQKENGGGQFGPIWNALPGIQNGMEHLLPGLITYGVLPGEVSWERLVEVSSYNTAARFGYLPRKGVIQQGADADIVVVNPNESKLVDENFYHGRGKECSIFWGEHLYGCPKATIVRGHVVQQNGDLVARAGRAQFIRARR